jgi:secreted trypsin-like serine protease
MVRDQPAWIFGASRTDHPRRGRIRRRVLFTIVVATLALMMALAGGPAALAASKRLPIKSGPNGLSRASGGVTTKIVGPGPEQVPLSDLRVVVGRTVLTSTQGQKRRVAAIDIHPRWDPATFSFDAAVIHLASPINGVRPIMLVTPGVDALERPGTLATVTGWGNTIQQPAGPGGGGVNYPDRMREAQVPITSRAECRTAYAAADLVITATMLCAGRTNLDTCQGDSGGPLFFKATGGGFIQAGITSWGIGCGATGFPGVYTRLSNRGVGNFILSVTGGVPVNSTQAA